MAVEQLFPRAASEGSFLGNMNLTTHFAGRAVPSFDHAFMSGSGDVLHYFVDAIETIAPLGTTTGGNPRQYAGANKTMYRLDNGVRTADTTFVDVVQGMVICDAGTSAGYAFAGTKMLLVGFGSSSTIRNATRSLSSDSLTVAGGAGPWTTDNAGAAFWLVTKAGADIYAVTDAGVAVLGEYRISKCPAGNNPTLAASWGNGLEVGTPEWAIVGLAAIGDSIVAGKPDGLYYYNDQTKRFENVLPHLVHAPHALNGKGMKSVTNGVLYPTHDGKLYFFDGVSVQEVTPLKGKTIPRDILNSRITAIADNGDTVAVVTECWQNTTQYLGLTVLVNQAGFTDITSSVTNGSLSNGGAFAGAGLTLYVGADVPIEGVVVRLTRNVNAASAYFGAPQYSDGAAGWPSFSGVIDGSILRDANISLVNTGFPTGASNAVLSWPDIDAYKKMKLETVNGSSKYWVRFPVTGTITAGTEIDEVEIVPGRAGLPDEGLLTQATNFTNRDRAGGVTHVWLGKREKTVGFSWHDAYAIHTHGGVWAMAWHTGRAPGGNLGQLLCLWGRYKQAYIMEGATRDPARSLSPALSYFGSSNPGPIFNLVPEGTVLGDHKRRKEVTAVYVDTKFASPDSSTDDDSFSLYMQWDETDIKHVGSWTGGPAKITVNNMGEGRIARFWIAHDYGIPSAPCAQIVGVDVEYGYVGERFEFARDRAIQLPETT